jgi:hypothetical protein
MIVGNGLIANAFDEYKDNDDIIIFSSGVSKSSEILESEFERERLLILKYLSYNKRFIYFSTCSISDNSKVTPYIRHKIDMENIIINNHKKYKLLI